MVEWKQVGYLWGEGEAPEYMLTLPTPLADWDVWQVWERERVHSMARELEYGDILFDVGTEQGWCNLVYSEIVGPENMVLIEPTSIFWPNIRQTWERNWASRADHQPLACYDGLIGNTTTDERVVLPLRTWPDASEGELVGANAYTYIHDNPGEVPQMSLDDLSSFLDVVPKAITIDIEGAELLALQGASRLLLDHKPKVWVSIHPDLAERDYHYDVVAVHALMASFGYTGHHLATDHEEHHYFEPPS